MIEVQRDLLCATLQAGPPAPDEMLGSMASVQLPEAEAPPPVQGIDLYGDPVHDALLAHRIQVMVTPWPQRPEGGRWRRLFRLSAAAYNDLDQVRRLAAAVAEVLAGTPA